MKKISRAAIYLLAIVTLPLFLTSCEDDDNIENDIYYNLTSTTWYAEAGGFYPDGQEYYSSDYWDFYGDGEGVWESYYEDDIYGSQQQTRYFQWDFSPYDPTVIHLYIQGVGHEYWAIDQLSPFKFSSYVTTYDPYYYPDAEYSYQTLYSLAN